MRICKKYQTPKRPAPSLACIIMLFAATAGATPLQAIQKAVEGTLMTRFKSAGIHDLQLRLTLLPQPQGSKVMVCPQPLTVELPDKFQLTRFKVGVLCNTGQGWRADYIARADASASIVLASSNISAGTPLDTSQIRMARQKIRHIDEALYSADAIKGLASKRPIKEGQRLRPAALEAATLVKRGDPVEMIAREEMIEVRVRGEALGNGRHGEEIRVRNLATGKTITARVTGQNEVEPGE